MQVKPIRIMSSTLCENSWRFVQAKTKRFFCFEDKLVYIDEDREHKQ